MFKLHFAETQEKICLNSLYNKDIIFWVYVPFHHLFFCFIAKSIRQVKRVSGSSENGRTL